MSYSASQTEVAAITALVPSLESEGFRVFMQPSPSLLPEFMRTYRPDAIAVRGDKKIAIEVMPGGGRPEQKRRQQSLEDLFSRHPEWELRIIYAPPWRRDDPIIVPPREVILKSLDRVLAVYDHSGPVAGLLMGWSVFEAAARSLLTTGLRGPQMAGNLVEELASDGYLTPVDADNLRKLLKLRNDAAHGGIGTVAAREALEQLVRATRNILEHEHLEPPKST